MEKIILYVDDAEYACEHFARCVAERTGTSPVGKSVHWVVVACAPRMTQRISKWVSHSARENWRSRWFAKTMDRLTPVLREHGGEVAAQLAKSPLVEFTRQLRLKHGATVPVIDARRPKIGVNLEPVAPDVPPASQSGWALPGAAAGMSALFILAGGLE